jgi:ribosomal protein L3 glutamine methyltransferase
MSTATLGEFLKKTEKAFLKAKLYFGHGTNNAWDEAVGLALAVLELPPDVDASIASRSLSQSELEMLEQLVKRRIEERMPLPYLSHQAWFAGLKFYVDERVIIPRSPLGELILNKFKPWWPKDRPVHRILDLCTGSGCIAIACTYAFPEAKVDAIDISTEALAVAERNRTEHHCEEGLRLIKSDLFEDADKQLYDIIISNPPYVNLKEMKSLPPEFQWEPRLALEAEQDGLSVVHRILAEAAQYLDKNGLLIVEVGNSEKALKKAYPKIPFIWLDFERGGEGVFLLKASDLTKF